jgi:ubiquitin C-terminal hydrolase
MRGLTNLGNTCYQNAALQCLLYAPPLANYLTSDLPERDLVAGASAARDTAIAFADLARTYWTTPLADPPRPLDTRRMWTALCDLHPAFKDRVPHDAHEAMTKVLDGLREYRVPYVARLDGPRGQAWAAECEATHSVVSAVFQGQVEARVTSPCGFCSVAYEHPVMFEVDVCSSVSAGFAALFRAEQVDRFVLPDGRVTTVTVEPRPTRLPFILIAHIKRFAPDRSKIDKFVDYSTTLDLTAWGDAAALYDLFAVCFHSGQHYVASCEVGGTWYTLDDERATPLNNINDVVHRDAYVLLYKKKTAD